MNPSSPRIDPQLWPEVSRRFDEAMELEPGRRAAWLAALEPAVRQAVQGLLDADASTRELGQPLQAVLEQALAPFEPGQEVGPYRLESLLGEGGMAQVWRAQPLQGLNRSVALKLPRGGARLHARFEQERDLLASLEHPHIARLYDAGVDGSQPWLAMECVAGEPVDRWASGKSLSERLRLFEQVLSAVAWAHQRLVVHCDLKPANLLVTADGELRLLDFGIAGLLGQGEGQTSAFSADSAAPEQLAGAAPSTAMDVHALGVLLYELIAGQRPYRLDRRSGVPLHAQRVQLDISAPAGPPELGAIALMAMAVQPQDRYASVDAMAQDLERWRQHQPVQARLRQGAGRGYRLARWLRRQRVAVAGGAAVALALLVGLGLALWQADRAREEAARAQVVQGLLEGLFDGATPERLAGADGGARALVLAGSDRAMAGLGGQPLLQADLLAATGRLLLKLQAPGPAAERLQRAVGLYEGQGRGGEAPALEARFRWAEALRLGADGKAALQQLDAVAAGGRALQGDRHRWALRGAVERGHVLTLLGRTEEALAEFARALTLPAPAGVDAAHQHLLARNGHADALLDLGRFDEARAGFEQVLAEAPAVAAFEISDRLAVRYNLNIALGMSGRFDAVVERGRPLVAEAQAHLGPRSVLVRNARNQLAQALVLRGHFLEAVQQQREVLRVAESTPGIAEDDLDHQRATLAVMLAAAGDTAAALPLARAAVQARDRRYPSPTQLREATRIWLGTVLLRAGRFDESAATLDEAARHLVTLPGHPHARWADATQLRALAERARGRLAEARASMAQACGVYRGAGAAGLNAARCRAHAAWMEAEAAPASATARAALEAAVQTYLALQPPGHVAHAEWRLMQASLARAGGERRAAAALQAEGERAWAHAMGRPWAGPIVGLR